MHCRIVPNLYATLFAYHWDSVGFPGKIPKLTTIRIVHVEQFSIIHVAFECTKNRTSKVIMK